MKIRIKQQITGTRNGVRWPEVGDTMVVPDAEGAQLCRQGIADPVAEEPQPEKRATTARKRSAKS